jgi:hypothetical protein
MKIRQYMQNRNATPFCVKSWGEAKTTSWCVCGRCGSCFCAQERLQHLRSEQQQKRKKSFHSVSACCHVVPPCGQKDRRLYASLVLKHIYECAERTYAKCIEKLRLQNWRSGFSPEKTRACSNTTTPLSTAAVGGKFVLDCAKKKQKNPFPCQ